MALQDLPLELFCHICRICVIPDIFSLRRCSSQLCQASKDRAIWLFHIVELCAKVHLNLKILIPNIETMSASQLEAIAVRHLRFHHLARKWAGLEPPSISRSLSVENDAFQSIKICRGGRFCFSSSSKTLYLWDLGFADSSELVCRVDIEHPWIEIQGASTLVNPIRDLGSEILVAVTVYPPEQTEFDDEANRVFIFVVDILSASPCFYSLNNQPINMYTPAYVASLHKHKMVFVNHEEVNPSVGLYFYETAVSITWSTRESYEWMSILQESSGYAIAVHGIHAPGVSFFKLPDQSTFGESTKIQLDPIGHFEMPEWRGGVTWTHSFDNSMHKSSALFERWTYNDSGDVVLLRQALRLDPLTRRPALAPPSESLLPKASFGAHVRDVEDPFGPWFTSYAFPDGMRCLSWVDQHDDDPGGATLKVHFHDALGSFEPFHIILCTITAEDQKSTDPLPWPTHSLAPIVGRLCFLRNGVIQVKEFI
ncbi:hypothetical protein DL96DRAFT_1109410 [Flagelloscypha sp. PMI_526]|nr:hypothetical protein DL96DRAFT_1109410 [Flagelloscypha sp. PMI_526]